jgi:predicted nucleic acid-binding protein
MNASIVIDSSGWIEYFTDGPKADLFAPLIESGNFVVPSITIYEVYKKALSFRNETVAVDVTNQMKKGRIVELNEYLAIWAGKISHDFKLPMADAIILATAYATGATLWTMDADFKGIAGVEIITP